MLATSTVLLDREYRAQSESLVRKLTRLTRDRELAGDLAHESFVRLAREVEAGRLPLRPDAWLYRVGSNMAIDRIRRRQTADRMTPLLRQPDPAADPEQLWLRTELGARVDKELSRLTSVERRAILLAAVGFQPFEIADRLGRSRNATRTLLCRARAKLRAWLASSPA